MTNGGFTDRRNKTCLCDEPSNLFGNLQRNLRRRSQNKSHLCTGLWRRIAFTTTLKANAPWVVLKFFDTSAADRISQSNG